LQKRLSKLQFIMATPSSPISHYGAFDDVWALMILGGGRFPSAPIPWVTSLATVTRSGLLMNDQNDFGREGTALGTSAGNGVSASVSR